MPIESLTEAELDYVSGGGEIPNPPMPGDMLTPPAAAPGDILNPP